MECVVRNASDEERCVRNVTALMSEREKRRGLVAICESTAWAPDPSTVYQNIVDAMAETFDADQVHLHLLTVDGNRLVKRAFRAPDSFAEERGKAVPVSVGRMRWMMNNLKPIVMDYEHPHFCDEIPDLALVQGIKSAVSIPMVADSKLLGMCSLCYATATCWDDEGLEYLGEISSVLGVLIQRIQASKKAMELQMLDERKRLGAEIHDGISNLVGTLSVSAASVLAAYEERDYEAMRADLERLESTSIKTMRTLRNEMLSLRMPLDRTDGLIVGIEECLNGFERNWGIGVRLSIKASQPLIVPLHVSMQLIRILNESLSNVLRHSGATRVSVSLLEEPHFLTMTIEDNGHGFDVDAVPPERLGLKIMKERTASAGGSFTLMSTDEGTAICVDIPKVF